MPGDRFLIRNNEALHFVTFTIVSWIDLFTRPDYKNIIVDSLNFCVKNKGLVIFGWVLMTNHLHLLISSKEGSFQNDIIRDFKTHTSKQLSSSVSSGIESREWILDRFAYELDKGLKGSSKHKYRVWQAGYHGEECDGVIIKAQDKLDYIHENPVKQGIVYKAEDYVYSSAAAYADGESLVDIVFL